jgi:GntR family transcriptional regulator, transcriptional repressor for pyruvate dehydrogenase complex
MLPKLIRGTLADQVTERLLEYIQAQHLKPGDLLPSETTLATSFGVSRPVIREALKNLEGKDVLEIVNGKGALVRPIDSDPLRLFFKRAMQMEQDTILELMEVRRGVEVQAAVLAAQRRTEKDLETIGQIVRAMRENIDDLDAFTQLDVELHVSIAVASHNSMLAYLVESIRDSLRNTIAAGLRSRGSALELDHIQRSHEALFETLSTGNVEATRRAMEWHFEEAITAMEHPQN